MKKRSILIVAGVAAALTFGSAVAQQGGNPAVNARKAVMQLYAFNLTTLGGMAQGKIDYDAAAASGAASNLAALTQMNQMAMWPGGSDNSNDPNTRALPALWENFPDVGAKAGALAEAAAAMESAAGEGLDALRGAMGPLGGACAACHESYRAPMN